MWQIVDIPVFVQRNIVSTMSCSFHPFGWWDIQFDYISTSNNLSKRSLHILIHAVKQGNHGTIWRILKYLMCQNRGSRDSNLICMYIAPKLILGLHPVNERCRYKVSRLSLARHKSRISHELDLKGQINAWEITLIDHSLHTYSYNESQRNPVH